MPVIPFGVGTSLEGHVAALYGGVCLDLSQMNRVLEVNAADLDCRVQAGVTREQLNAELKGTGLFFPIDPGANATIGGMAATRASGTNAVRYGTMRENVLGLTVVTPDGRIIRTGGRARKSRAGYDLTRLFVGAEGTLGVITEIQLRLYGVPEAISAAVCQFDDLDGAVDSGDRRDAARASRWRGSSSSTTCRWTRASAIRSSKASRRSRRCSSSSTAARPAWPSRPRRCRRSPPSTAAARFDWATQARGSHAAVEGAARGVLRGDGAAARQRRASPPTPACRSRGSPTASSRPRPTSTATGLVAPIVGHVGDGNFHLVVLFDPDDPAERERAEGLARRVSLRAIAMGGTCTGEHGIGVHKLDVLRHEHGEAVELDARDQARARSAQHHEPRQDGSPLT